MKRKFTLVTLLVLVAFMAVQCAPAATEEAMEAQPDAETLAEEVAVPGGGSRAGR